ncbi:hypothetical protein OEV98_10950 [Caldibacillus lycopersici]|uniref:Uncharacterized protein n=1 Tax=Perspicuibacillus lycopersici TaxID=1325689 RepID=A0AAE3ITG5_9BACI|nr:hypothetical protein [Perspicuibacillus lycopersici]MCU9614077.1 hypothetical protein [Perspicuibacillus lycopersici]
MDDKKRLRLSYIKYGLKESRKRLKNSVNSGRSVPINASLSEILFWIIAMDEWHIKNRNLGNSYKKRRKIEIGGQYVLGLRHAYNSLKHNMTFIKPMRTKNLIEFIKNSEIYAEDYTSEILWVKVDRMIDEHDTEYNIKNYKKYIEGKGIIQTIDGAINFLNKVNGELQYQFHSTK